MNVILAHENADFDAVAALLAAAKLFPDAAAVLPDQRNRNVAAFLALYANGLPFRQRADVDFSVVETAILVDSQRPPQIRGLPADVHLKIFDHHPPRNDLPEGAEFSGELLGAATTLLVEQIQAQGVALTSLEATLLALGIYEDTGSLTYAQTSARDIRAAAWLIEQHAALDTVRRFLDPPLGDEQKALFERLLSAADTRAIQGHSITVCAGRVDDYVSEIAGIAHRLREILDSDGLFVLVEMPTALHLVCRAASEAVDAGEVARAFGGGGHERAAAASLHDIGFGEALDRLWQRIAAAVRPAVRVGDLMSYGLQTVSADRPLNAVAGQMRRIGHEGFPVVEGGRLVGLLTRRDADRALEHGLGNLAVRDVMTSGQVQLKRDDSVAQLEQVMVESGWGQIPVSDDGKLIGIVTRTDLIKHWARTHPASNGAKPPRIALKDIETVLGKGVARLIEIIAGMAQEQGVTLYLVGGVVRDLLLKRPNDDVDFVVEGDAIALAHDLQARYGGHVSSFNPFGTAKWTLDAIAANATGSTGGPVQVDFATARNEFYEHPTALPTVYNGSIKLDLLRRDFTMNTLAVQFSPAVASGLLLDFYGGLGDLRAGLIRVLNNLSFVDDPTRMLRAVRFEQRLGFQIELRTAELMVTALPMLRRITGERVRNELNLCMREAAPERVLVALQERGMLAAVHPAFVLDSRLAERLQWARTERAPWPMETPDSAVLGWHMVATLLSPAALEAVCERLLMPQSQANMMLATSRLVEALDWLDGDDARPSQIAARLDGCADTVLLAAWLAAAPDSRARARIVQHAVKWRHVRSTVNGHTLQGMGLKPGPCYAIILARLRAARLDGEIESEVDEHALVRKLIDEGMCDGHS